MNKLACTLRMNERGIRVCYLTKKFITLPVDIELFVFFFGFAFITIAVRIWMCVRHLKCGYCYFWESLVICMNYSNYQLRFRSLWTSIIFRRTTTETSFALLLCLLFLVNFLSNYYWNNNFLSFLWRLQGKLSRRFHSAKSIITWIAFIIPETICRLNNDLRMTWSCFDISCFEG